MHFVISNILYEPVEYVITGTVSSGRKLQFATTRPTATIMIYGDNPVEFPKAHQDADNIPTSAGATGIGIMRRNVVAAINKRITYGDHDIPDGKSTLEIQAPKPLEEITAPIEIIVASRINAFHPIHFSNCFQVRIWNPGRKKNMVPINATIVISSTGYQELKIQSTNITRTTTHT